MRMKRFSKLGLFLLWEIFLLTSTSWGQPTLMSVKKGRNGDKSWAVLAFDEKAVWVGISQLGEDMLTLYFWGRSGDWDGSTISLGPVSHGELSINQMESNSSIFRSDIMYDGRVPLAVLKKGRNLVVAFNDQRMLEGKMATWDDDVSVTPGRLVNVAPSIEGNQMMTSFWFDGSYDWVGYVRPSRDAAALLIHGAEIITDDNDFSFDESPLRNVRLYSESGEVPSLKAVMFFEKASSFSVVRKPQSIVVQTPYTLEKPVYQVDKASVLPALSFFDKKRDEALIEEWLDEDLEVMEQPEMAEMVEPQLEIPQPPDTVKSADLFEEGGRLEEEKSMAGSVDEVKPVETEGDGIGWNDIVSFRFSSTPMRDALRTIAISNGLNMVIGDGVEGLVTMNLQDVTLRQALNKIIHTNDCEYIVDAGILTVKPVKVAYSGGRITKVYRLKYADAGNLAKVLSQVVTNDSLVQIFYPEFLNFLEAGKNRMTSNRVAVQGIRRSSILVVTDRPEKIREVDQVVRELDTPPVQIMIESKLVEAAPLKKSELGINWDKTLTTVLRWQEILPGGDEQDYSLINTEPDQGGEWRMGHLSASQFQAVLDFLKEKTDSKLISNPRLLAMDNEESSISVGTTVPVPRIQRGLGGQGDMVTFEYKEVNIQLNVTPHMTANGDITMYVNPVIEEITGWVEYERHRAPITDKRAVNSIVSVKNGETVVIGGLIKSQRLRTTQKVWFLGSIPLLGKLFEHETYEDKQTDLMIFITPTIVQAG